MEPLPVIRERLYRQRLAADRLSTPDEVVGWLGAMQAQEYAEAKWSIAQRTRGCTDADVEAAFERGDILRTHVLRPTWHFVARRDIRWLLRVTAPRVHALNRYQYKQLGLDDELLTRGADLLGRVLDDGEPRTRSELAESLRGGGIEAEGPRLGYIVMYAELEELVCSGPRRGRQHTYALLEQRAPDALDLTREEALAELARRYFTSRGPATIRDLTAWSSITVADAKAGLASVEAELVRVDGEDGTPWFSAPGTAGKRAPTGAFLVATYDEMVMGYRDLRFVLPEHPTRPDAWTRSVVIDGRTVGSWKRNVSKSEARIDAALFTPLGAGEKAALETEVERFGRFNGLPGVLATHEQGG